MSTPSEADPWLGDVHDGVAAWTRSAPPPPSAAPPPDPVADGPAADPESVARKILLDQLTGQARTRSELATKLAKRGVPDDVAKRLIDYGFHAPTMSFPVAGTLMIEPTESESRQEIDRFCDAMIAIRREIERVAGGEYDPADNPLKHAPHTAAHLLADDWKHAYTREEAAYPVPALREAKYWPPVRRIDQAHGDRNLVCSCPPPESFED